MKRVLFPILALVLALGLTVPVVAHTEDDPDVTDLIAGGGNPESAMVAGDVNVWNDGDNLSVQYVTTGGWCLTETHLHVATFMDGIPQRNGNPVPGQFDYPMEHDCVTQYTYTIPLDEGWVPCETYLYIAAHAVVQKVITEAPYYASSVVDYNQGLTKGGVSVREERSTQEQGLAFESGQNESNFFSLGFGGWIVVEFDCPIRNGDGNDVRIIEDTWGTGYPPETANVSASQDGTNWTLLGEADNTDPDHTISEFDLDTLQWAKYIKIVDTTNPDVHGSTADGFDLNAVASLQDCIQEETAWGAGSDFLGKNWATYFEYHIQEPCVSGEVINGGFEAPVVGTTQGWDIYDSATSEFGWTVEWYNVPETWGSWTRPDPAYLELHKISALGVTPSEGNQYAELDTDWNGPVASGPNGEPASVKIYQDIKTCPGKTYKLTYAWRPRPNHGNNVLQVLWAGNLLTTHLGSGGGQTSWTLETWTVLVPSTSDTTRLEFIETATADSLGMFLDAVSLTEE